MVENKISVLQGLLISGELDVMLMNDGFEDDTLAMLPVKKEELLLAALRIGRLIGN